MARSRVVIIGAGFGGLSAARALRKAEADVLVVDRHNDHLFLAPVAIQQGIHAGRNVMAVIEGGAPMAEVKPGTENVRRPSGGVG